MGRSIAGFTLEGSTEEGVLEKVESFGRANGFIFDDTSEHTIMTRRGSKWWRGARVLQVTTWPSSSGVEVRVEAWVEATNLGDLSADPSAVLWPFRREDTAQLASALVAQLGASGPSSTFRHE